MTEPDILQDLDAWIALYPHANIAQRARDEIARLRRQKAELWDAMQTKLYAARAEALEEAALALETLRAHYQLDDTNGVFNATVDICVTAIRALKATEGSRHDD